jgi:hypothetical protein
MQSGTGDRRVAIEREENHAVAALGGHRHSPDPRDTLCGGGIGLNDRLILENDLDMIILSQGM